MAQKHARIESLGIEQYLEPPFEAFRDLSPEDFVRKVLVECFGARAVFCGNNFTFGARAAGNVERLRALCDPLGISVQIVPMAQYGSQAVSSTRIRAALEEGRLDDANAMLGAPYAIDWTITHGKGIGTSRLGTPTVNQKLSARCPAALQRRLSDPHPAGRTLVARCHRHRTAPPRWTTAPTRPSPVRPTCRISPGTCTARIRCWNFTGITARCASSARWKNCPSSSTARRGRARPILPLRR